MSLLTGAGRSITAPDTTDALFAFVGWPGRLTAAPRWSAVAVAHPNWSCPHDGGSVVWPWNPRPGQMVKEVVADAQARCGAGSRFKIGVLSVCACVAESSLATVRRDPAVTMHAGDFIRDGVCGPGVVCFNKPWRAGQATSPQPSRTRWQSASWISWRRPQSCSSWAGACATGCLTLSTTNRQTTAPRAPQLPAVVRPAATMRA